MPKKIEPGKPEEYPTPEKHPEIQEPVEPVLPVIPREDPDIIPAEVPSQDPPDEVPPQPAEVP